MRTYLTVILTWALALSAATAEIDIRDLSQGLTGDDLVKKLLGGGVEVFNIQYTGATNASGLFCEGEPSVGFDVGVLLTSGDAANVLPPNDESAAGTDNDLPGDPDLDGLIPGFETFDASVLEFDFVAQGDSVQFNYVFGSEEYNEFVDTSFNDVFGFFVNGVNFALIPGTATPVAINNVNNGNAPAGEPSSGPCMNCQFYVDNVGSNATLETQLDGLTTVLTFTAPVLAGETNHLKIAISDAGDGILDSAVFIEAGSLRSGSGTTNCVTRDSRFWMTHVFDPNPECATLERAMALAVNTGCEGLDLGFIELPVGFRNDDNVKDEIDATIEAIGLYYRNQKKTGESAGTQSKGIKGSRLCRERKRCAVELIAGLANQFLFETFPENCSYEEKGVTIYFPDTLFDDARDVLAGFDQDEIKAMTSLLKKFNSSGLTNDFPVGIVECTPTSKKKELKRDSRDPTSQFTCPGQNSNCAAADAVYFKDADNPFALAKYKSKASFRDFGIQRAWWFIDASIAPAGRRFTADTFGSNVDTILAVYRGECNVVISNGVETVDLSGLTIVSINDNAEGSGNLQSKTSFNADGDVNYLLGVSGGSGKVKFHVTSP